MLSPIKRKESIDAIYPMPASEEPLQFSCNPVQVPKTSQAQAQEEK